MQTAASTQPPSHPPRNQSDDAARLSKFSSTTKPSKQPSTHREKLALVLKHSKKKHQRTSNRIGGNNTRLLFLSAPSLSRGVYPLGILKPMRRWMIGPDCQPRRQAEGPSAAPDGRTEGQGDTTHGIYGQTDRWFGFRDFIEVRHPEV